MYDNEEEYKNKSDKSSSFVDNLNSRDYINIGMDEFNLPSVDDIINELEVEGMINTNG
jgi:hypothetical protein